MIFKLKLYLIIIFLITNSNLKAIENKILIKINREIITSQDINNYSKYLALINPQFENLDQNDKINISKKGIINQKLKK